MRVGVIATVDCVCVCDVCVATAHRHCSCTSAVASSFDSVRLVVDTSNIYNIHGYSVGVNKCVADR